MDGASAPHTRGTASLVVALLALAFAPAAATAAVRDFDPLAGNPLGKPAGQTKPAPPAWAAPGPRSKPPEATSPAPGRVLVRFRAGASAGQRDAALARRSAIAGAAVPGTRFVRVRTGGGDPGAAARGLERDPAVAEAVPDHTRRAAAAPNDPQYVKGHQGNLDTFRLPGAWDRARATKDQVLAVLDTGVDLDHPDLAPQLVPGRDIVGADDRPDDQNGHGTQVASIAAARADNGAGMAGVAYGAGIMPVRVLRSHGRGYDSDIAAGIAWAADHGADVLTLALEGEAPSPVLDEAVAAARAKGVVVIAASGNWGGCRSTAYPAASPGVLAVAATDWSGDLAHRSTCGPWVDLAAPGMRMVAATPSDTEGGDWQTLQEGTSLAAGFAAGAALLVRAQNPAWTPAQVESRLLATARDAGPPGRDPYYGQGVIDPLGAVGGPPLPHSALNSDGNGSLESARVLTEGSYYDALEVEGDEDWFAVDSPEAGELAANVWVEDYDYGDGRRLDAVLDILDPSGRLVTTVDEEWEDDEETAYAHVPAGRSYVRVRNYAPSRVATRYGIWVGTTPGTPAETKRFETQAVVADERSAHSTAVGDVTGDGRPDVLATQDHWGDNKDAAVPEQLLVHPVDADGELGTIRTYDLGARDEYNGGGNEGTLGAYEMDITTGDVNGDGEGDAVAAVGRWIGVLRGTGTGLAPIEPVPASRGARQVEIADLDRDGRLDLVGRLDGERAGGAPVAGLTAYMQEADGSFDPVAIARGRFADVGVGDLTGDGRPDLAAFGEQGLTIVRQTTDGGWQPLAPEPLEEEYADAVEVADLTGDGRADVVTSGWSYDTGAKLRIRAQSAAGSLGAPTVRAMTAGVVGLATGRVDGDRRLDLVVSRQGEEDAGVFLQRTDGTLGPESSEYIGDPSCCTIATALTLGDFTGDGLADLVHGASGLVVARQRSATWPRPEWLRGSTPAVGATDVATGATLALRVTRALSPGTITPRTVRLARGDTGAVVAATPAYDSATRTLSVTPDAPLAPGTSYVLTIPGVRDGRAAKPPATLALRFATAGATDTTPPDTGFSSAPAGTLRSGFWASAYASEPGTGTQCSLDGAAFADCEPELYAPATTKGQHTFRVRAVDAAGNVDPTPAARTFIADPDGAPPANNDADTPRVLTGASGSITASSARSVEYRYLHDATGQTVPYTGESGGGRPVFFSWTASQDGIATFSTAGSAFDTILGAFSAGSGCCAEVRRLGHDDDASATDRTSRVAFRVRQGRTYRLVVDGFGDTLHAPNGAIALAWSTASGSDTAPPDTVIDSGPPPRIDGEAQFDFHASEPGSAFECKIEGGNYYTGEWSACRTPWNPVGTSNVGSYTASIRAIDQAGNVDPTPAVRSWERVDFPRTEITARPATSSSRTARVEFTAAPAAARFECRLDRGAWTACSSPHTITGLTEGRHEFQVVGIGDIGQRALPVSTGWSVEPEQVLPTPAGSSAAPQPVRADFDGDGRSDLAIGIPGEDVEAPGGDGESVTDAGAVQILYSAASGPSATRSRLLTPTLGLSDGYDAFGAALAAGDFNADGFADLAVGAPGRREASGEVTVFPGSATGLDPARSREWEQGYYSYLPDGPEALDGFGASLAAGDANGDGRADLAIGVPGESDGTIADAGAVHVLLGGEYGLTAGNLFFTQASAGILDDPEPGDAFGSSLAFGRLGSDARAELVVGAPGEDLGAVRDAGAVHVLPGATGGVTGSLSRLWTQDSPDVADTAERSDRFGTVVAAGNVRGGPAHELIIGVPQEDAGTVRDAGAIHILPGGTARETATGSRVLMQPGAGGGERAEAGDRFGGALATADLGGSSYEDLAIGVPFEDLGSVVDAGALHVLPGASSGPSAEGARVWTQATSGVADSPEASDRFGAALAAGAYGGAAQGDLAVAVPGEGFSYAPGAGALHVLAGAADGLTAGAGTLWSQASSGVADHPEAGDGFGAGLGR